MPNNPDESPGTIPQVNIPTSALPDIASWIEEELSRSLGERSGLEEKIAAWYKAYEAEPKVRKKTFPWEDASNLVVPVIATHTESIVARLIGAIFGAGDVWKAVPKSAAWVGVAEPIERWINWVGREILKLYEKCQNAILANSKTGNGIFKLVWERRRKNVVLPSAGGGMERQEVITHDGPVLTNVPLIDFLVSSDAITPQDIQNCEWVAHRIVRTRKQLEMLRISQIYTNVERVMGNYRSEIPEVEQNTNREVGIEPTESRDYEIWEFWCTYDVDGDGISEEILIDYHRDTKTILRAIYNPYFHQERPFHIIRHMPRDNHILGIGLGQMLMDTQTEVSTIHNQRLDNATLANMKVYKRKRGCNISVKDIYPGAVIPVNEDTDLTSMDMGTEHSTLLSEELHSNSIGEKRSGVSDYTVGRESSAIGSRATATSTLALIGEGNKRFQFIIKDVRYVLTEIAHQVIGLYQQFAPEGRVEFQMFSEQEKMYITQYMQLPREISKEHIFLDIPAIDEIHNKQMQQQVNLSLMGMSKEFYTGIVEALALIANPQVPPMMKAIAQQGVMAATKLWEKTLQSFDVVDTKAYVPDLGGIFGGQNQGYSGAGPGGTVLGGYQNPLEGTAGTSPEQFGMGERPTEVLPGTGESTNPTGGNTVPGNNITGV